MATIHPDTIRVIAFREGDAWVAQCLEYDIFAQGADFQTAMRRLTAAVNTECRFTQEKHGQPFVGLDPAPSVFHDMFIEAAQTLTSNNLELRIAA